MAFSTLFAICLLVPAFATAQSFGGGFGGASFFPFGQSAGTAIGTASALQGRAFSSGNTMTHGGFSNSQALGQAEGLQAATTSIANSQSSGFSRRRRNAVALLAPIVVGDQQQDLQHAGPSVLVGNLQSGATSIAAAQSSSSSRRRRNAAEVMASGVDDVPERQEDFQHDGPADGIQLNWLNEDANEDIPAASSGYRRKRQATIPASSGAVIIPGSIFNDSLPVLTVAPKIISAHPAGHHQVSSAAASTSIISLAFVPLLVACFFV